MDFRKKVTLQRAREVLWYFRLKESAGGRQRRMSFQLGTGRGFDGVPELSMTEWSNPSTNIAVTNFKSTLASREPRHFVLPVIKEGKKSISVTALKAQCRKFIPPPQPTKLNGM